MTSQRKKQRCSPDSAAFLDHPDCESKKWFKSFLTACKEKTRLADLTLCYEGREFEVHKLIACSSSSFFDAACSGESEENVCRRIDLSDDPRIIACMVSFMYDLDYEDDFELCSGDVIVDEKRKDPPAMPLTTNARVWLVAEKYDVKGLKECAVQKTTKIFDTVRWWYKDLASAAELAWKQTESSENKLRNIYVENFLNQRSDIFDAHESKEMVAIFGSNPEFLWEVLRKDWEQQQESNKT